MRARRCSSSLTASGSSFTRSSGSFWKSYRGGGVALFSGAVAELPYAVQAPAGGPAPRQPRAAVLIAQQQLHRPRHPLDLLWSDDREGAFAAQVVLLPAVLIAAAQQVHHRKGARILHADPAVGVIAEAVHLA